MRNQPVESNRQLTLEELIEMAQLEAEAAQFDPSSASSDEEDYTDEDYREDWENDEQDEDEEEMQRHEEAAHTVSIDSQTYFNYQLSMPAPQTAQSLVDRIRPLQEEYNMQMLRAQQAAESQLETVRWQSLIEVVDDTE